MVLELGGNAAVIVDRDADLDDAAQRIVFGAFYQSGQSCIGVQRILVARGRLRRPARAAGDGDRGAADGRSRRIPTNFIGPMISETEAARLESWIAAALRAGGRLLVGGKRRGALHEATLLEDVPADQDVVCREAFGPVAVLSRFRDFDAALAQVNDSVLRAAGRRSSPAISTRRSGPGTSSRWAAS